MIEKADVVIDLQAGDTGKGKVAHSLAKSGDYDIVMRFNGGANAGHTIYHNGTKIVTHQVPVGIFYGIPSIIGPGCVVNLDKLHDEMEMLKENGFSAPLYIDKRTHVTLQKHIEADMKDMKIGTTKQGIGPTYRDKIDRVGMRIEDFKHMNSDYDVVDIYDILHKNQNFKNFLCEGAQGFQIDIDWGDYPFVTASSCTVGAVVTNGIAPRYIKKVFGVMKAYETYSGFKNFTNKNNNHGHYKIFEKIQEIGQEFGATTGRKRQVRWLDLDGVIQAMHINNVTDLIINKIDVLDQVGTYGVMYEKHLHVFKHRGDFITFVENVINWNYRHELSSIKWSTSPHGI